LKSRPPWERRAVRIITEKKRKLKREKKFDKGEAGGKKRTGPQEDR